MSASFRTPLTFRRFLKAFGILVALTFGFFVVLPHGDELRGGSSGSSPINDPSNTGLSDSVDLGNVVALKKDRSKRIVVPNADPIVGTLRGAYWKGERFDRFTGSGWVRMPEATDSTRTFSSRASENAAKIVFYDRNSKTIPLPAIPAAISVALPEGRWISVRAKSGDPTLFRTSLPMGQSLAASVDFHALRPAADTGVLVGSGSFPIPEIPMQVEELFAPYWASVPESVSKDPKKLSAYVRGESGFSYSLDAPAKDLRSFLYSEKRGHCEYYATVLAVSLWHFGFPATVVNGYSSGDFSAFSDDWIVRGEDAHAWVEMPLADGRWKILDPTPGSGLVVKSPLDEAVSGVLGLYDLADVLWYEYVVSFNLSAQADLISRTLAFLWRALPYAAATALVLAAFHTVVRVVRKRGRSEAEKFLDRIRKEAKTRFPLEAFELSHPELVKETREALYSDKPSVRPVSDLSRAWSILLKKK